jgi:hypothetical protein
MAKAKKVTLVRGGRRLATVSQKKADNAAREAERRDRNEGRKK